MIAKYLLDPMEDERLTVLPYEVWHYMVTLEWACTNDYVGFDFGDAREGYDKGYTPRRFIMEKYASAVMTAVDAQNPFVQWVNNHADKPGMLMELMRAPNAQVKVGRDSAGWLLQVWCGGLCVGAMRFDKRAPAPPGWDAKVRG